MAQKSITALFLSFSRMKLLEQYWPRMKQCVESLTDEQVWWRPNPESNSVGNLMLHLNGNVTQWMIASFNRLKDKRNRPAEFAYRPPKPKEGLDGAPTGPRRDEERGASARHMQIPTLAQKKGEGGAPEITKAELIAMLGATVERAGETMARLTEADLTATYEIQGFSVSGLQAVYQVIEHFGLHYGQVLYITKMLTGRDTQFTKGQLDSSGKALKKQIDP